MARHESRAEGVGDLVRRSVAHRGASASLPISLMKADTAFVSRAIVSEKFSRSCFAKADPRVVFDRRISHAIIARILLRHAIRLRSMEKLAWNSWTGLFHANSSQSG